MISLVLGFLFIDADDFFSREKTLQVYSKCAHEIECSSGFFSDNHCVPVTCRVMFIRALRSQAELSHLADEYLSLGERGNEHMNRPRSGQWSRKCLHRIGEPG
jgi:hypothetical protein